MIQCVGSRNEHNNYCSRICCTQAIKNALKIKQLHPSARIAVLYRDVRTYGLKESYYRQARQKGIMFFRYEEGAEPLVRRRKGELVVRFRDLVLGESIEMRPTRLVLSVGLVPAKDNASLAKVLKLPLNEDGFFMEAHAKLRPMEFAADGVFLCGLAHSPRCIEESIVQAMGAAGKAASLLSREYVEAKGVAVSLKERWCSGCGLCVSVCPYDARELDEVTGTARVTAVLCQGCGACVAVCPNGATQQPGFGKDKIMSMLDAALST
jgi:heterodisulfide reductase subunit A